MGLSNQTMEEFTIDPWKTLHAKERWEDASRPRSDTDVVMEKVNVTYEPDWNICRVKGLHGLGVGGPSSDKIKLVAG